MAFALSTIPPWPPFISGALHLSLSRALSLSLGIVSSIIGLSGRIRQWYRRSNLASVQQRGESEKEKRGTGGGRMVNGQRAGAYSYGIRTSQP